MARPVKPLASQVTHSFNCTGCGASMTYSSSAKNLVCPFCGSQKLEEKDLKTITAKRIIPFQISQGEAIARLKNWMGKGFWRPRDLATNAEITKLTPVYVPYWLFSAKTSTNWTGDTSKLPNFSSGDWAPVAGTHQGEYDQILVGASSTLTPYETKSVAPFDFLQSRPFHGEESTEYTIEQFCVPRKYARPHAYQEINRLERDTCRKYIPGRSRNVNANVLTREMSSYPVLVPVWIMAYNYEKKVYRFLLNGQNGKPSGTPPFSIGKALGVVTIVVAIVTAILLLFLVVGGLISLMN